MFKGGVLYGDLVLTVLTVFTIFCRNPLETPSGRSCSAGPPPLSSSSRDRQEDRNPTRRTLRTVINTGLMHAVPGMLAVHMYGTVEGAPTEGPREAIQEHCAGCHGTRVVYRDPSPRTVRRSQEASSLLLFPGPAGGARRPLTLPGPSGGARRPL